MDDDVSCIAKAPESELDSEKGFVLVSVIWIAGLLAIVATAFVITVRSHTLAGSNVVFNTKAELVADGMTILTALRLATNSGAEKLPKPNGETIRCRWSNDVAVAFSIQDQGGLIDLNTSSPELLNVLIRSTGTGETRSQEIVAALRDFRDPDSLSSIGGDEPVTYPGKSYGPKNAPFDVPEEIDQVPEVDDALLHKLVPHLTTYSQQSGIDPALAPKPLLDIFKNASSPNHSPSRFTSPSSNKTFSIDVMAELANGSRYRRMAIVTLLGQPDRPYAILAWHRGRGSEQLAPLSANGVSCLN